jgi:hypothetical protein
MSQGCHLCVEPDALRAFARDVHTTIGHYPAGIPIVVVRISKIGMATVCLDHPYGHHLGARCHAVTVPVDWLD